MKWSDEEIDKIAQEAAGKVEVPYNDQYWSEMEALLDANVPLTSEARSNRKGFWWLFGVFLALIGFATSFSLMQTNSDSFRQKTQANLEDSQELRLTQAQENSSNRNSNIESEIVLESLTEKSAESTDRNANDDIQSKILNQNTSQNETQKTRELNPVAVENNSNLNHQFDLDQKSTKRTTKKIATNRIPVLASSESKMTRNEKQMSTEFSGKFNSPTNNELELSKHKAKEQLHANKQVGTEVGNQTNNQVKGQVKSIAGNDDRTPANKALNSDKQADTSQITSENKPADSTRAEHVQNENRDALALEVVDTANQSTAKDISSDLNKIQKEIQKAVSTPSYYLQAGMRFSQSALKTAANQLMTGINIGIGYQYIKPGFGYSIGLHLTSSIVQNMEITRKSRVYGLSVVNYQQDLRYTQLTFLEMPIQLNFIQFKNTFSAGISPTYLASTMMRFTERQESVVTNEHNYYGQKIGFRSLGLDLNFGYQRAIKNNWSVGVQLGVSLIQKIEKNQFAAESVAFPVYGQIAMRKTLIPKK